MRNFDDWYKELVSNYVWSEPAQMQHRPETFKKICHKVYMNYTANNGVIPIEESRKHVYNIVVNTPGDAKKVEWWKEKKEEEEKKEEWKPASDEHVAKCVAEFDEMMKNSSMMNAFPRIGYKQSIEEGGWLPKKEAPYPATSKEEAYVRDRHFEYVKYAYEPRTGLKRADAISEDEFNLQYDNDML